MTMKSKLFVAVWVVLTTIAQAQPGKQKIGQDQIDALVKTKRLLVQMGYLENAIKSNVWNEIQAYREFELPNDHIKQVDDSTVVIRLANSHNQPEAMIEGIFKENRLRSIRVYGIHKPIESKALESKKTQSIQVCHDDATNKGKITSLRMSDHTSNESFRLDFVYAGDTLKRVASIEEEKNRLWREFTIKNDLVMESMGYVLKWTGPNQQKMAKAVKTTFEYDQKGRLTLVFQEDLSDAKIYDITRIRYLADGKMEGIVYAKRAGVTKGIMRLFTYNDKNLVQLETRYDFPFEFIKPDFTFDQFKADINPTITINTYTNNITTQQNRKYESRCLDKYSVINFTFGELGLLQQVTSQDDNRTKCTY